MAKVGKWLKTKNLEKITEWATKKENAIAIMIEDVETAEYTEGADNSDG